MNFVGAFQSSQKFHLRGRRKILGRFFQGDLCVRESIGDCGQEFQERQMTYEELFEYVDAEPFRPFRIQMASGRTFDVRHPEMIRVGTHSVVVFEYLEDDERIYERFKMLGLQLVESTEHIDSPVVQNQD
jgi:hypothetical protein